MFIINLVHLAFKYVVLFSDSLANSNLSYPKKILNQNLLIFIGFKLCYCVMLNVNFSSFAEK